MIVILGFLLDKYFLLILDLSTVATEYKITWEFGKFVVILFNIDQQLKKKDPPEFIVNLDAINICNYFPLWFYVFSFGPFPHPSWSHYSDDLTP